MTEKFQVDSKIETFSVMTVTKVFKIKLYHSSTYLPRLNYSK